MAESRTRPVRLPALTGPNALGLIRALRYCWITAIGIGVVATAAACAVAWHLLPPPRYTAFALLQIASRPPQLAFAILETQSETKDEVDKYQKTQIELLKSRFVLNAALRDPQVVGLATIREETDPREWLLKELNVEFLNGSDILRIALRGERPNDVAVIVNAIMSAYLREVVTLEEGKRRRRMEQLKEAYDSYQALLATRRQFFRDLAESAGSNDQKTLAYKQQLEMERQAAAEKELQEYRLKLREARAELEVAESRTKTRAEPSVAERNARVKQLLAQDSSYRDLEAAHSKIESRIARARLTARSSNDAAIRAFSVERAAALARLESYRQAVLGQLAKEDGPDAVDDKTTELRDRVAVLEQLEKTAVEDLRRFTDRANASTKTTLDLQSRQDEIAHLEGAAKKIGDDIEALKVELRAEQRITERERADVPRQKEDKRLMMVALAGCATFFLVLLGFSWREFQVHRIDSEHQVFTSLGINVVGALPVLPDMDRRVAALPASSKDVRRPVRGLPAKRQAQAHNLLVESIDAARTMIMHLSCDIGSPVLMVTSALRGEGKTSLSCHLAMSLARAGRRTLLLDFDLRNPSVHTAFDVPLDKGMSEFLRDDAILDEIIRPLPITGLSMISAGRCDSRALQALVRMDLRSVFDRLAEQFDFVIVDAAPVLPVTDSLLIGRHVDAVLFSVLRDVSRLPKVRTAYDRLGDLGIRTLGAVVAGARMDTSGYGDYLRMSVLDGTLGGKS